LCVSGQHATATAIAGFCCSAPFAVKQTLQMNRDPQLLAAANMLEKVGVIAACEHSANAVQPVKS
jgi:hypothetical protein